MGLAMGCSGRYGWGGFPGARGVLSGLVPLLQAYWPGVRDEWVRC
jgi:hypothetical protein